MSELIERLLANVPAFIELGEIFVRASCGCAMQAEYELLEDELFWRKHNETLGEKVQRMFNEWMFAKYPTKLPRKGVYLMRRFFDDNPALMDEVWTKFAEVWKENEKIWKKEEEDAKHGIVARQA
jgi:hypothetical protein